MITTLKIDFMQTYVCWALTLPLWIDCLSCIPSRIFLQWVRNLKEMSSVLLVQLKKQRNILTTPLSHVQDRTMISRDVVLTHGVLTPIVRLNGRAGNSIIAKIIILIDWPGKTGNYSDYVYISACSNAVISLVKSWIKCVFQV